MLSQPIHFTIRTWRRVVMNSSVPSRTAGRVQGWYIWCARCKALGVEATPSSPGGLNRGTPKTQGTGAGFLHPRPRSSHPPCFRSHSRHQDKQRGKHTTYNQSSPISCESSCEASLESSRNYHAVSA